MLIANGFRAGGGPHRLLGAAHYASANLLTGVGGGAWRNFHAGEASLNADNGMYGIPTGVRHPVSVILAQKPGALASIKEREASASAAATIAEGRPIAGATDGSSTAQAILQLVVSGTGTAAGVATVTGNVQAAINGAGTSAGTSTASASIGAIADLLGTSAGVATASGTPWGLGWMVGEITPYTELSPQSLSDAVWSAILSNYPDAGTAGNALSTASTGGVDLGALADAVRAELGVELAAVLEVWRRHGLDISAPLTQTATSITAGTIDLAITGDPDTSVTVTRQP